MPDFLRQSARMGLTTMLIATLTGVALSQAPPARAAKAPSTGAGSFAEQARRGSKRFLENCAMCHAPDLKGRDPAPALTGDHFTKKWQGKTLWDLYDKIRKTMPQQSRGSLSPKTYLEIVAYMAKFNDINPGKGELKNDPKSLKSVLIGKPGDKAVATAGGSPSM